MKEIKSRSNCPVSYTLDFLGDKWSLLIIRDIMVYEKPTYGEFLCSDEKIATNILANRLEMLEENGFITKKVSPDKKNKFNFSLTEKAIALVPLIMEMAIWGSRFNPPGLDPELMDSLNEDKEGTIIALQEKLRSALQK
ncbi:MAG: helix-turn-helix domain-containing protein [Mucilaginibacter sp.]|uniref:winged helix-turn-helix transcriptional regulator n=1 Tax=Mucilaginibacter sp. TaxID=1882438 RepID=UPI0031A8F29C